MVRRFIGLLSVLIIVGGLLAGSAPADQSAPAKEDYYELHRLLVDTLDQVERNYVKDISRRELIEAAIKGVLKELDPYSSYIDPDAMKRFRADVESEFGGIGIQITMDSGQLKVLSPLVGTPAYRAGLMAGDRILEIDGNSTKGITLDEAVRQLKGEEGTEVRLKVSHPSRTDQAEVTIVREVIKVETVLGDRRKLDDRWDLILDDKKQIGYVRVTAFSRNTARELRAGLAALKKANIHGLILDLRFNPGGLLSSAIEVCDMFVSDGRIVSTKGRNTEEHVWNAKKNGTFEDFKIVVLVNRYSASASEIVSACLQDHKRAVIMGERTWGKGSVQNVIELEEGNSALKLTTASYRRPSGKNIHRFPDVDEDGEWGVKPDKEYELKLTDGQMLAMVKDRRQRDILRAKQPGQADAAKSDDSSDDSEPEEGPEPEKSQESSDDEQTQPTENVAEEKNGDQSAEDASKTEPEESTVIDPQLQMAIDYLRGELAKAE